MQFDRPVILRLAVLGGEEPPFDNVLRPLAPELFALFDVFDAMALERIVGAE